VADSGFPHSIGYVKKKIELVKEKISTALEHFKEGKVNLDDLENTLKDNLRSVAPLRRPLVKYTPGWGRSYIPPTQEKRELIATYKQVPNPQIIHDMRIILVDDSIRRGTQLQDLLREKIWPYRPKEIHGRIASPPQMYPCIFDLSTRRRDLATCRAIKEIEEDKEVNKYADENTEEYKAMVEGIRKTIGFTTLRFQTLGNLIEAVVETKNNKGLKREDLCLYCWTGKS
jgi:amidophosphoribosyltransferase